MSKNPRVNIFPVGVMSIVNAFTGRSCSLAHFVVHSIAEYRSEILWYVNAADSTIAMVRHTAILRLCFDLDGSMG